MKVYSLIVSGLLVSGCCTPPAIQPPAILTAPVYVNESLLVPCSVPLFQPLKTEHDVAVYVSNVLESFVDCSTRQRAIVEILRSTLNQPTPVSSTSPQ